MGRDWEICDKAAKLHWVAGLKFLERGFYSRALWNFTVCKINIVPKSAFQAGVHYENKILPYKAVTLIYLCCHQISLALREADECLKQVEANNAWMMFLKGLCHMTYGNHKEAVDCIERAKSLDKSLYETFERHQVQWLNYVLTTPAGSFVTDPVDSYTSDAYMMLKIAVSKTMPAGYDKIKEMDRSPNVAQLMARFLPGLLETDLWMGPNGGTADELVKAFSGETYEGTNDQGEQMVPLPKVSHILEITEIIDGEDEVTSVGKQTAALSVQPDKTDESPGSIQTSKVKDQDKSNEDKKKDQKDDPTSTEIVLHSDLLATGAEKFKETEENRALSRIFYEISKITKVFSYWRQEDYVNQALEFDPNNAGCIEFYKKEALDWLHDKFPLAQALKDFEIAWQANPEYPALLVYKAVVKMRYRKYDEGLKLFEEAYSKSYAARDDIDRCLIEVLKFQRKTELVKSLPSNVAERINGKAVVMIALATADGQVMIAGLDPSQKPK